MDLKFPILGFRCFCRAFGVPGSGVSGLQGLGFRGFRGYRGSIFGFVDVGFRSMIRIAVAPERGAMGFGTSGLQVERLRVYSAIHRGDF